MTLFDLILIAVSLSMDAFAVSICKGLSVRKVSLAHALTCGVWFGGFQFLMPALGYFLGDRFAALLTKFGPWIAFVLLAIIGANMIKESLSKEEENQINLLLLVRKLIDFHLYAKDVLRKHIVTKESIIITLEKLRRITKTN